MSFRDTILQNVRNNQPSSRELPAIPKFHSEQPVDLKKMSGPSGSADIGGITVHPAQGVMTLTVIFWPRQGPVVT